MASSLLALVTQPRDAGGMGVSLPAAGVDPATLTALIVLALVFPLANLPTMRLLARFNTLGVLCVLLILIFAFLTLILTVLLHLHLIIDGHLLTLVLAILILGIAALPGSSTAYCKTYWKVVIVGHLG